MKAVDTLKDGSEYIVELDNFDVEEKYGNCNYPTDTYADRLHKGVIRDILLNGRLDCVIIDRNPAMVFQANYPDQLKLSDGAAFTFEAEQYAIAMPKGDTALAEKVNAALAEIKADGTFDKLVEQYIQN
jgi:polar amino acid transport system substrate-binding protein